MQETNVHRKLLDLKSLKPFRKGSFVAVITGTALKSRDGKPVDKVYLEIVRGKYEGFKVSSEFDNSFKGDLRFAYLCEAVGITGELENLDDLLGRKVRIGLVPKRYQRNGRTFVRHVITRFHPVKKD